MTNTNIDAAFDSFDIAELQVLDVAEGVALPEMGASGSANAIAESSIGCSSSSSTCSSSSC